MIYLNIFKNLKDRSRLMDDAKDARTRRLMYIAYMTLSARKSDKIRRDLVRSYLSTFCV